MGTLDELRRLESKLSQRHVMKQTWDSGHPSASPDGYLRWCAGCGRRPWPCLEARFLAGARELLDVAEAARRLRDAHGTPAFNQLLGHLFQEVARLEEPRDAE